MQQIGFGWGKGRRVIKTTIAGEALTRALAKQQRFVDAHGLIDDRCDHTSRALVDALEQAPGARRTPLKLRMAKARLRPTPRTA